MSFDTKANAIVRRKAKRIQRAANLVSYLKSDIENINGISDETKKYLLESIADMQPYLQNDDYQENKYNQDNRNG